MTWAPVPAPPPATAPQYAYGQGGAGSSGGGSYTPGPAFRAYQSSAQSIPSGTVTKVNYQTEVYDSDNAFDPTTSTFTAPVAGYYNFTASFATGGGFTTATAVLFKNGTSNINGDQITASGFRVTVMGDMLLAIGDTVDARVSVTPGVSGSTGSASTYFMGHMVRPA